MFSVRKINDDIQFKTIACCKLRDEELRQCKDLFDHHYGRWGEGSPKEGQRIKSKSGPQRNAEAERQDHDD